MLTFRLLQPYTGKFPRAAQQAHILEAAGAQGIGVLLVLREQGKVLGDQLLRRGIPVIQVVMGHYHGVHLEQGRHGQWQLDQGIAQVTVGCALEAGIGSFGCQHGIDQEAGSGVVDEQGGVANLGDFHGVLSAGWRKCNQYGAGGARA